MPRTARIVLPGLPHHVTQRGNNRQEVFFTDDDHRAYLKILSIQANRHQLRVLGYCLMSNHVHLVVVPPSVSSLAAAMGRTHLVYAQRVNEAYDRCGHLWQNRFYSCPVGEDHLLAVLRYVECNPVRAGVVPCAWDYPWSSAAAHTGMGAGAGALDLRGWEQRVSFSDWREILGRPLPEAEMKRVRAQTRSGHPLVADTQIEFIEQQLGRRLRPCRMGRPRRTEK